MGPHKRTLWVESDLLIPLELNNSPLTVEASVVTNGTSSIGKKFYVRINFIELILQKIRSSTCRAELKKIPIPKLKPFE